MSLETALLIVLCGVGGVLAMVLVDMARREREISRIARELLNHDIASNARILLHVHTPALEALAQAINALLEAEQERAIAHRRSREAFQEDLAALSHDIRTPLAGAQGYLQLARMTDNAQEHNNDIVRAEERLSSMRTLVDGLFEYAQATDPSFSPECVPVALMPVLSEVLADMYPRFIAREWEPHISIDDETVAVLADERALTRVLENLMTNALRYGISAPRIVSQTKKTESPCAFPMMCLMQVHLTPTNCLTVFIVLKLLDLVKGLDWALLLLLILLMRWVARCKPGLTNPPLPSKLFLSKLVIWHKYLSQNL